MQSSQLVNLDEIEGSLAWVDGLAFPQWQIIEQWINDHIEEVARPRARTSATEQWLAKVAAPMGYHVVTTDNFLIMTRADNDDLRRLIRVCEGCLTRIVRTLRLARLDSRFERMTVLAFAAWRPYRRYLHHVMPMDDHRAFAGVFIGDLYPYVIIKTKHVELTRLLAHELTHACLHHLPLPLWLNEGLTQVCEDVVVEASSFHLTAASAAEQEAFWREHSLESFWDGTAFYSDAASHAYTLAAVLVRTMLVDYGERFPKFVERANRADAGQLAAQAILGVGLEDRVAIYLGPGDWRPKGGCYEPPQSDEGTSTGCTAASGSPWMEKVSGTVY